MLPKKRRRKKCDAMVACGWTSERSRETEQQVLSLIGQINTTYQRGASAHEIARLLRINHGTVKGIVTRLRNRGLATARYRERRSLWLTANGTAAAMFVVVTLPPSPQHPRRSRRQTRNAGLTTKAIYGVEHYRWLALLSAQQRGPEQMIVSAEHMRQQKIAQLAAWRSHYPGAVTLTEAAHQLGLTKGGLQYHLRMGHFAGVIANPSHTLLLIPPASIAVFLAERRPPGRPKGAIIPETI